MAPVIAHVYSSAISVTDANSNQIPGNQNLEFSPISGVTDGDWLIAVIGWHSINQVPATISVGDDATNNWQPIVTSPATTVATAINANPNFTSGLTGWGQVGATTSVVTNETYGTNTQAIKMVPLGGASTRATFQASVVTVTPQQYYTTSMWVFSPAGYANATALISWYNTGVFLSNTVGVVTAIPPGTWTQVLASAPSPSNANQGLCAVQLNNSPQPGDIIYIGQGTLTPGNGWSATTRCAIWAAPNARSSTTAISVCPLGSVTAIAGVVMDVTGMPAWLQTNTSVSGLAKASTTLSLSVTPSKNSLVVSTGALNNLTYTLNQLRLGWSSVGYFVSSSNTVDTVGDIAVITKNQITSSAITATWYGVTPLNSNSNFSSLTGWQAINGTLTLSSGVSYVGTHSGLLTPNGTSASVTAQITHASAPGVISGHPYLGAAYVQANGSTASIKVGIEWINVSGTTISTIFSSDLTVPADGTWYPLLIQGIAPATTVTASLHVVIDGTPPVSRKVNIGQGALGPITQPGVDVAGAIAGFQLAPTSEPAQPNANWPDLRLEAAFGQEASTPPDQLVWTDVSNRMLAVSTDRGRQYELNSLEAGSATFSLRNDDGYLTPGSPLDPGLLVYTPFRLTALWNHRVYGVFQGYMERWPQTWQDAHFGIVPSVGVDAWAMFTATLTTVVRSEILVSGPALYWPCADGSAYSSATNIGLSANQTALTMKQSPFGTGSSTASFGDANMLLPGDTNTDWACNGLTSLQGNQGTSLVYNSGTPLPPITNGITFRFFVHVFASQPFATSNVNIFTVIGRAGPIAAIQMANDGTMHVLTWNATTGVMTNHGSSGFSIFGTSAQFVLILYPNSYNFYIDSIYTTTGNDTLATTCTSFSLNGRSDSFATGNFGNLAFSHVAVFSRPLVTTEINTQWIAGAFAVANDFGRERVSRLISFLQWAPPQRIMSDVLANTMAGALDIDGLVVGSAITNIGQTEQALLYVDRNGYLTYRPRNHAVDRPIQATLGENTALGELPYRVTLELDYDPQYINNDIQVTHVGNIPSGQTAPSSVDIMLKDSNSISQFGDHSLQLNSYFNNVSQSVNLANYLLSQYSEPLLRVAQVELIPAANPTQFTTLLGLDIGDRLILNRRPIGAALISLNVMIIGIHHDIEWKSGKWSMKLDLMPASIAALQIKTLTLNDAVLGKLDSTNVIGW